MKWVYQIKGSHVHVSVYMNGALCGNLCFRFGEFQEIMKTSVGITFVAIESNRPCERAA